MISKASANSATHFDRPRPILTQLLNLSDYLFDPRVFDAEKLKASLPRLALQCERLARAPELPHEVYGRHVIWSTPGNEIMVAKWRPGVECAPHDHGHSLGMVLALEGTFVETGYEITGDSGGLQKVSEHEIAHPQLMSVYDGDVHSMRCTGAHGGLTVHFYRPAIRAMKVYDLENRRTYTVTDDCGAWIPLENQILDVENW